MTGAYGTIPTSRLSTSAVIPAKAEIQISMRHEASLDPRLCGGDDLCDGYEMSPRLSAFAKASAG